jgi:hypothetical protein
MSTAVASAIIAAAALAFSIVSFQFQQCRAARLAKGNVNPVNSRGFGLVRRA